MRWRVLNRVLPNLVSCFDRGGFVFALILFAAVTLRPGPVTAQNFWNDLQRGAEKALGNALSNQPNQAPSPVPQEQAPAPVPQASPNYPPQSNLNADRVAVADSQRMLNKLGYNVGVPDGVYGPKTRAAIEGFTRSRKFPVQGNVTTQLLVQLSQAIEQPVTSGNMASTGDTASTSGDTATTSDTASTQSAQQPANSSALSGNWLFAGDPHAREVGSRYEIEHKGDQFAIKVISLALVNGRLEEWVSSYVKCTVGRGVCQATIDHLKTNSSVTKIEWKAYLKDNDVVVEQAQNWRGGTPKLQRYVFSPTSDNQTLIIQSTNIEFYGDRQQPGYGSKWAYKRAPS